MSQQIPQPFVIATFNSTTLKTFPITFPGTKETGKEIDKDRKRVEEVKQKCVGVGSSRNIRHRSVKEDAARQIRVLGSKHALYSL